MRGPPSRRPACGKCARCLGRPIVGSSFQPSPQVRPGRRRRLPASPRRPRAARPRPVPAGKRRRGARRVPEAGDLPRRRHYPCLFEHLRSAAAGIASSSSTYPPGICHVPRPGLSPRWIREALPSRLATPSQPIDASPKWKKPNLSAGHAGYSRPPSIFVQSVDPAPRTVHRWSHRTARSSPQRVIDHRDHRRQVHV